MYSFFVFCIVDRFLKIKKLLAEKLEGLRDIGVVKRIKEDEKESYFSASEIDMLYG